MIKQHPPDIVAALTRGLDTRDTWGSDKLHASDLSVAVPPNEGGKCAKQLWLRVHGYKSNPPGLGKLLMFDHGNRIHEQIPKLLERGLKGTGWVVEHVELSLKGLLHEDIDSGRLDTLLYHKMSGTRLVIDYKTVRGRAFRFLDKPKPTHVIQVRVYIEAFDVDGAIIIYIDREGENGIASFVVERDDDAVKAAARVARAVVNSVDAPPTLRPQLEIMQNKGPDSVKLKQPWQCDYCEMRGPSCPGALPLHLLDLGIVAKIPKDGSVPIKWVTEDEEVMGLVTTLLREREASQYDIASDFDQES